LLFTLRGGLPEESGLLLRVRLIGQKVGELLLAVRGEGTEFILVGLEDLRHDGGEGGVLVCCLLAELLVGEGGREGGRIRGG
jgi:hypothetical protein